MMMMDHEADGLDVSAAHGGGGGGGFGWDTGDAGGGWDRWEPEGSADECLSIHVTMEYEEEEEAVDVEDFGIFKDLNVSPVRKVRRRGAVACR